MQANFKTELITRWKKCREISESSGAGMTGVMVDEGLVDWLDDQLHKIEKEQETQNTDGYDLAELQKVATEIHGSDEIEVDDLSEDDLSEADEHVWVRGWLYVNHEELNTYPGKEDE